MRTTLVNSTILLLSAAMLLVQDSAAYARGPAGGVQTLATPSIGGGGGRGGSIGSSGLSFGSGGISFGGGGGRVTIGTGAGGISFGTRGHTPTPNFNPSRKEIPDYRGSRGSIHVVPEIQIVPQMRLPNPTPSYVPQPTYTQPTFRPNLVQSTPQIQPNELPSNPAPEPIATDPIANTSGLVGRQITEVEVQRAKEFFQQRLLDLAKVLEQRLPPAQYDPEQLTALMLQHSIPVEIQIQIFDALNRGQYDQAREIWVTIVPQVEIPFKPSRIRILFLKFYVMIERGYISYPVVQELIQQLPPEVLRPNTCCGADDLLVQIEEEVRINQAIGGMTTETSTDYGKPELFSKPQSNDRPYTYTSTEVQTDESFGKPDSFGKPGGFGETPPYGKPGQPVPIPSGPVNIVYHPKLPDRQVVVVNAQTVMIGTGGRGVFSMEHGYVAEALGHRIGLGTPMAENQSELVRSGVVVVNATHAKVGFVFGSHQVVLEPGYQQALGGKDVISFDRGGGKGTARYTLEPGTYEFQVGADGWDVLSKTYEVTVSNEGNLEPFNYIVQGEQVSLAPEESRTHTSNYPILIRFDRGDGSATRQIRWEKSQGTLQIAINPSDNLWDFFVSNEVEAEKSILQPTPDFVPAF
jgi:hypothetical protein